MRPLMIALLASFVSGAEGDCGCGTSVMNVNQGEIGIVTAPNYPQSYTCGLTSCTWFLSANGYPVTLQFQSDFFDLEPGYDFLEMYDGNSTSNTLLQRCSGTYCQSVTSSGPSMMVILIKDDSDVANFRGFLGSFYGKSCGAQTTTPAPSTVAPPGTCITCSDLANQGYQDGTYELQLWDDAAQRHVSVMALCDMDRGGYTVFQQRVDGCVRFNRTWVAYKHGFGNVDTSGSFWLGNEALHLLTANCGAVSLRADMALCDNSSAYETYDQFQVGPESDYYRASLSGAAGTATDALNYDHSDSYDVDGSVFSTLDADNNGEDCSTSQGSGGGWWYGFSCSAAFPNGGYDSTCTNQCCSTPGIYWYGWPDGDWSPSMAYFRLAVK